MHKHQIRSLHNRAQFKKKNLLLKNLPNLRSRCSLTQLFQLLKSKQFKLITFQLKILSIIFNHKSVNSLLHSLLVKNKVWITQLSHSLTKWKLHQTYRQKKLHLPLCPQFVCQCVITNHLLLSAHIKVAEPVSQILSAKRNPPSSKFTRCNISFLVKLVLEDASNLQQNDIVLILLKNPNIYLTYNLLINLTNLVV